MSCHRPPAPVEKTHICKDFEKFRGFTVGPYGAELNDPWISSWVMHLFTRTTVMRWGETADMEEEDAESDKNVKKESKIEGDRWKYKNAERGVNRWQRSSSIRQLFGCVSLCPERGAVNTDLLWTAGPHRHTVSVMQIKRDTISFTLVFFFTKSFDFWFSCMDTVNIQWRNLEKPHAGGPIYKKPSSVDSVCSSMPPRCSPTDHKGVKCLVILSSQHMLIELKTKDVSLI